MSKARILIVGSCVSRDVLEIPSAKESFTLVDYYARSSLATLANTRLPTVPVGTLERIESAFQRRMVERDLNKSLLRDLPTHDFDRILLDLIDERFDLWLGTDQAATTISAEITRSGFPSNTSDGRRVSSGCPEFIALWRQGWERLCACLRSMGRLQDLVVNRVFWSRATESGQGFGTAFKPEQIAWANEVLRQMYAWIERSAPEVSLIGFDAKELQAADEHRWARSPFHYVPAYYESVVKQLLRLGLGAAHPEPRANSDALATRPASPPLPGQRPLLAASPSGTARNLEQWKLPVMSHAPGASMVVGFHGRTGIHVFEGADGQLPLEVMAHGFDVSISDDGAFLVGLHGAATGRASLQGPFFAGLGMARELGLPLIAFADPTVSEEREVDLAWYAGHDRAGAILDRVAALISSVQSQTGLRPVLFGGSGGGFACLKLAERLKGPIGCLVWNAQTDIARYAPDVVVNYLVHAWPHRLATELPGLQVQDPRKAEVSELGRLLDLAGVDRQARVDRLQPLAQVVYLQNATDWHVEKHLTPYFTPEAERQKLVGEASSRLFGTSRQGVICVGDWGTGHEGPPREIIADLLQALCRGDSSANIAKGWDDRYRQSGRVRFKFEVDRPPPAFEVTGRIVGQRLELELTIETMMGGVLVAYYLVVAGQRVGMRWYERNVKAGFDLPPDFDSSRSKVVAFVRDCFGFQYSKEVDCARLS